MTWRPIPSAPGYEVRADGAVRSVDRIQRRPDRRWGGTYPVRLRGKVLRAIPAGTHGHLQVTLGVGRKCSVRRLVAEVFGPCAFCGSTRPFLPSDTRAKGVQ